MTGNGKGVLLRGALNCSLHAPRGLRHDPHRLPRRVRCHRHVGNVIITATVALPSRRGVNSGGFFLIGRKMKILLCGGREYADAKKLYETMDKVHAKKAITLLIHGQANGADKLGREWAKSRGIPLVSSMIIDLASLGLSENIELGLKRTLKP